MEKRRRERAREKREAKCLRPIRQQVNTARQLQTSPGDQADTQRNTAVRAPDAELETGAANERPSHNEPKQTTSGQREGETGEIAETP